MHQVEGQGLIVVLLALLGLELLISIHLLQLMIQAIISDRTSRPFFYLTGQSLPDCFKFSENVPGGALVLNALRFARNRLHFRR